MIKDLHENEYKEQQSKIRKLWVSLVDKDAFSHLEKEERFKLYKKIDYDIMKRYYHLINNRKKSGVLTENQKISSMLEAAGDVISQYGFSDEANND